MPLKVFYQTEVSYSFIILGNVANKLTKPLDALVWWGQQELSSVCWQRTSEMRKTTDWLFSYLPVKFDRFIYFFVFHLNIPTFYPNEFYIYCYEEMPFEQKQKNSLPFFLIFCVPEVTKLTLTLFFEGIDCPSFLFFCISAVVD